MKAPADPRFALSVSSSDVWRAPARLMPNAAGVAMLWAAALITLAPTTLRAAIPAPLVLERKIALPGVEGRIDHMAYDPGRGVLFIGEVGAGALEAVEVKTGRRTGRIEHLSEPQGVAYLSREDEVAVASGGDGTIRFYAAADLRLVATLKLKGDADNLRVDPRSGRLIAADGSGFAVIDPKTHAIVSRTEVGDHPEGFQIEPRGGQVVANVPNQHRIVAADLATGKLTASWRQLFLMNFPMTLGPSGLAATVFRAPATLLVFDGRTGATVARRGACGDSDDLAFDPVRPRLYVTCGSGGVQVFEVRGKDFSSLGVVATRAGARTSLFVPQLDRLFVAARASGGQAAAILVLKPQP